MSRPCVDCGADRYEWTDIHHTHVRCCECHREYPAQRPFTFESAQDELFIRAVELGCTPVWANYRWECRCPRNAHGYSLSQPVIRGETLQNFRERYLSV